MLSREATLERSKSLESLDKSEKEKQIEEDELAGYQEDSLIDVDPECSAAADSPTTSIGEAPGISWREKEENKNASL